MAPPMLSNVCTALAEATGGSWSAEGIGPAEQEHADLPASCQPGARGILSIVPRLFLYCRGCPIRGESVRCGLAHPLRKFSPAAILVSILVDPTSGVLPPSAQAGPWRRPQPVRDLNDADRPWRWGQPKTVMPNSTPSLTADPGERSDPNIAGREKAPEDAQADRQGLNDVRHML